MFTPQALALSTALVCTGCAQVTMQHAIATAAVVAQEACTTAGEVVIERRARGALTAEQAQETLETVHARCSEARAALGVLDASAAQIEAVAR